MPPARAESAGPDAPRTRGRWHQALLLVLGVWLLLSPFALEHAPTGAWNARLLGGALALLALAGLRARPLWGAWGELVLGLWLMGSAFALGAPSPSACWNLLLVGALVVTLALIAVFLRPHPSRPGPAAERPKRTPRGDRGVRGVGAGGRVRPLRAPSPGGRRRSPRGR